MDKRTNGTEKGGEKHAKAVGKGGEKFVIPRHISTEMRRWISGLLAEWEFSVEDFKTLILAATSWDLAERCRIVIAKKSPVYTDRFGSPKARPECAVLRDSRIAFLRCMAALNLAPEEPESEEEQAKRPYNNNFRRLPEWVEHQRAREAAASDEVVE